MYTSGRFAIREDERDVKLEVTRLWECEVCSGSRGGAVGVGVGVGIGVGVGVGVGVRIGIGVEVWVGVDVGFGVGCVGVGKGEGGRDKGGCGGGGWGSGEGGGGRGKYCAGDGGGDGGAVGEVGVGCVWGCGDYRKGWELVAGVGSEAGARSGAGGRERGEVRASMNDRWFDSSYDCNLYVSEDNSSAQLSPEVCKHVGQCADRAAFCDLGVNCTAELGCAHETGNGRCVRDACHCQVMSDGRVVALFCCMAVGGRSLLWHRAAGDELIGTGAVVAISLCMLSVLFGLAFNVVADQKRRAGQNKNTTEVREQALLVSARWGCRAARYVTLLCWVPAVGGIAAGSPTPSPSPSNKFTREADLKTAAQEYNANEAFATSKYGPIASWDVSEISDMSELFKQLTGFDADISSWDTSGVTDMSNMFEARSARALPTLLAPRPFTALSPACSLPSFRLGRARKRSISS